MKTDVYINVVRNAAGVAIGFNRPPTQYHATAEQALDYAISEYGLTLPVMTVFTCPEPEFCDGVRTVHQAVRWNTDSPAGVTEWRCLECGNGWYAGLR